MNENNPGDRGINSKFGGSVGGCSARAKIMLILVQFVLGNRRKENRARKRNGVNESQPQASYVQPKFAFDYSFKRYYPMPVLI